MTRLSNIALLAIKGSGLKTKRRIAAVAGCVSVRTVDRWIKTNDDTLTKVAILQVIREETGLLDSEILEASDVKEPQS
jgi:hypothetical protein